MVLSENLRAILRKKRQIDLEFAKAVADELCEDVRFSSKKFVADLGELYFRQHASLFSELKQSAKSNESCDFRGILKPEFQSDFGLTSEILRVEVKTRHAQKGNNHIFGLKPEKFDLLAFVALDEEFECRHIGIIKSSDIKIDKGNRITYSPYYNEGLVRWRFNEWIEL